MSLQGPDTGAGPRQARVRLLHSLELGSLCSSWLRGSHGPPGLWILGAPPALMPHLKPDTSLAVSGARFTLLNYLLDLCETFLPAHQDSPMPEPDKARNQPTSPVECAS